MAKASYGQMEQRLGTLTTTASVLAFSCLLFLVADHLYAVLHYSVNIPLDDDWDLIVNGLNRRLDFSWLVAQHNEHRIILTKLLVWILYRLNGWNVSVNHVVNALIWMVVVILTVVLTRRALRQQATWIAWAGACFLLPGAIAVNLLWAIQSSFGFLVFFTLLAAFLLFTEAPSRPRLLAGSLASVAAAYSFSAGVAASVTLVAVFGLAELQNRNAQLMTRVLSVLLVVVVHAIALSFYFVGYGPRQDGYPLIPPTYELFWAYLIELLALGYGWESVGFYVAYALACFTLVPGIMWLEASRRAPRAEWAVFAAWMSALAMLAAITYGRAGLGVLEWSKSPRYLQLAAMVVPFTFALWQMFLRDLSSATRKMAWTAAAALLWFTSASTWAIQSHYREQHERLLDGARCVAQHFADPSDPVACPIYPAPLRNHVDLAVRLGLSPMREYAAKQVTRDILPTDPAR
jgi:hypothetical protein